MATANVFSFKLEHRNDLIIIIIYDDLCSSKNMFVTYQRLYSSR